MQISASRKPIISDGVVSSFSPGYVLDACYVEKTNSVVLVIFNEKHSLYSKKGSSKSNLNLTLTLWNLDQDRFIWITTCDRCVTSIKLLGIFTIGNREALKYNCISNQQQQTANQMHKFIMMKGTGYLDLNTGNLIPDDSQVLKIPHSPSTQIVTNSPFDQELLIDNHSGKLESYKPHARILDYSILEGRVGYIVLEGGVNHSTSDKLMKKYIVLIDNNQSTKCQYEGKDELSLAFIPNVPAIFIGRTDGTIYKFNYETKEVDFFGRTSFPKVSKIMLVTEFLVSSYNGACLGGIEVYHEKSKQKLLYTKFYDNLGKTLTMGTKFLYSVGRNFFTINLPKLKVATMEKKEFNESKKEGTLTHQFSKLSLNGHMK